MTLPENCRLASQLYKPKCNHDSCWEKFFTNNIGKTMAARYLYLKVGKVPFEMKFGYKYTKHFIRYIQKLEKKKYGTISTGTNE